MMKFYCGFITGMLTGAWITSGDNAKRFVAWHNVYLLPWLEGLFIVIVICAFVFTVWKIWKRLAEPPRHPRND